MACNLPKARPPGQAWGPETEESLFLGAAIHNYFLTCVLCHLSEMSVGGGLVHRETESKMCPFNITEITPLS